MFKLKYFLIGLFAVVQSVLAHNPHSSSLRLTVVERGGVLELSLSQYGVEQALIKKYPDMDLKSMEQNEFKENLIQYIKETISFSANGKALKIGSGIIKLGSHQTDVKFKILNIPKEIKYLDADVHCFKENEKQANFLTLSYNGLVCRAKLTKESNFVSHFVVNEHKISIDYNTKDVSKSGLISIIAIFFLVMVFLGLKFRR